MKIINFFKNIGMVILNSFLRLFKTIYHSILSLGKNIKKQFKSYIEIFKKGNKNTKASFFIMGFGVFRTGQKARGIMYFLAQVFIILYMVLFGFGSIRRLITLGVNKGIPAGWVDDPTNPLGGYYTDGIPPDNSLLFLLYGIATILIILLILFEYLTSIKNAYENQIIIEKGHKPIGFKEEVKTYLDDKFYRTVLVIPLALVTILTILPLVYMVLIAFTNYNKVNTYPGNPFGWVGFENFNSILIGGSNTAKTFFDTLKWTFIWAISATALNYILGLILAILINKRGIRFKKVWRTIFILSIAVPQFVSLLGISKMLADGGIVNSMLIKYGIIDKAIPFLSKGSTAKITVIIINLWVGVPYTMLITSGILMNIPKDMYESSKIDGASAFKQFMYITMPYMLFVTGPYLITQFIGNINNFNVIYFLTGGGPVRFDYESGSTDLLITWLYKLTANESNYGLASALGIIIFIISSGVSLILYNNISSTKNEEDLQ